MDLQTNLVRSNSGHFLVLATSNDDLVLDGWDYYRFPACWNNRLVHSGSLHLARPDLDQPCGPCLTLAEYVGMGEATKAALWGRRLLAELEGKGEQAVPLLLGDNKGAVQLTRGVSNTSKIKHIDIAFHHVVDEVKEGRIQVFWVPGENMLADGMSKPLTKEAFERNRKRIGIGPC